MEIIVTYAKKRIGGTYNSFEEISNYDDVNSIICDGNQLKSLPPLPPKLSLLMCHDNQLKSLPPLPPNLRRLVCHNNQLESLPPLPDLLKLLYCDNNQLKTLPPLPPNLKELRCESNQLESIPKLPDSLEILKCMYNPIEVLPTFSKNLREVEHDYINFDFFGELAKQINIYQKRFIYCINPDKNIFIKNLFSEFGQDCSRCKNKFFNYDGYYTREETIYKIRECNNCKNKK